MGSWTGSDESESRESLDLAVQLGCTFFDTALRYGSGRSERLVGELVRRHPDKQLYVATKAPPKVWPSRPGFRLDDCFPPDHIRECTLKSLENLSLPHVDLLQFHTWEDSWANDVRWQHTVEALKVEGLIRAVGVSIKDWKTASVLATLRTGHVDTVQVIYNIFEQAPEDQLLPVCAELGIGVIARVPFDEGSLTGHLTRDSR